MIVVKPIPLDLVPEDLTGLEGVSPESAESLVQAAFSFFSPATCFDKTATADLLGPDASIEFWGEKVLAGALSLGAEADGRPAGVTDEKTWSEVRRLVLSRAVDFAAYRMRLFLKPENKAPGARFVPGCPDLPSEAEQRILDFIGNEKAESIAYRAGFRQTDAGLTFIYPIVDPEVNPNNPCLACTRKDCPSRL